MLTDIEISKQTKMLHIKEVAKRLGILEEELEYYGPYKAKIDPSIFTRLKERKEGKLVLVTSINPTPAGEGKTTTTIGIGQAFSKLNKNAVVVLREPSLGPVFGVKGGATGGGYAQVVPMEEINLHFTGDFHAITSANNLLCAAIDNHIKQGNELGIDIENIFFKRVMDMNDRALREVEVGIGKGNGIRRKDGFMITVASEVMAIFCLSKDIMDLKDRLGQIMIAYDLAGNSVYAKDLKVHGAMAALLKDAIKPNLIQTTENTPCIMHGGPFANIAHGCNSIIATKLGLKLSDFVITEAGFGADLGGEKFLDIKCRIGDLKPSVIVIVATIKALKYNGFVPKEEPLAENIEALEKGSANLKRHIENMKKYGVPIVVALNQYTHDTDCEIEVIEHLCKEQGVEFALSRVHAEGGTGGITLAKKIEEQANKASNFKPLYEETLSIKEKIEKITKEIYGAKEVEYSELAESKIQKIQKSHLPICIAKTQYSFSDDPKLLGSPEGFKFHVQDVRLSEGAGFIVVLAGDIMTMPGLPKTPSYEKVDIDENGKIVGIF